MRKINKVILFFVLINTKRLRMYLCSNKTEFLFLIGL